MHLLHGDIDKLTTTSADGTPLAITRVGNGPDVVVMHGGMDDATSWLPVARALAQHHRCWLVHRRRADTGGTYSLDSEIDDLEAVLGDIRKPAPVVGHSFGALIVLRALLRTPALPISAAVLYEPPLTAGGPVVGDLLAPITAAAVRGDHATALHIYLRDVAGATPTAAEEQSHNPWLQSQVPALLPEIEVADRLLWTPEVYADITVPTMLLLGERSAEHPNRDSTLALDRIMPNAHLVGLPRHGHLAHLRAPAYVATLIRSYLADPARPATGAVA